MTELVIANDLAEQLGAIAQEEQRPIEDVLRSLLELYKASRPAGSKPSDEALRAMAGMFDDDITDMSTTVRETMEAYYRQKYGDTH
jgi:hypothetical protein